MKDNKTYDLERVPLWKVVPLDTPYQLCIEPTFRCNFRCNYCMHAAPREYLESRGFYLEDMPFEMYEKIVEQTAAFPSKIKKVCFTGFGEPLLNKRLPEMIRVMKKRGTANKILIITNASLLTPELSDQLLDSGLTELKISLQSMNARKYKEICGINIDWDKLYENISYFSRVKGDAILRLKIADTGLDSDEEKLFYSKFNDICDYVAVEHIYSQFSGVDYNGQLLPSQLNRFGFEFKRQNVCSSMFFKLNVLQSGRITFGYPDGVTFEGFNVDDMTLFEAWNSPERTKLLRDNLTDRSLICKECVNCTRWDFSVVPEDSLDGHEAEILSKLPMPTSSFYRKMNVMCANEANC